MADADHPDQWVTDLLEALSHPSPEEEAFFAERRARGIGVGLAADGSLVREAQAPEPSPRSSNVRRK